jgi:hypothetical protein
MVIISEDEGKAIKQHPLRDVLEKLRAQRKRFRHNSPSMSHFLGTEGMFEAPNVLGLR